MISQRQRNQSSRAALRAAYERLTRSGVAGLHYLPGDGQLGDDGESSVDSSHPTDLGFFRQAEAMLPPLNLDQADDMNDDEIERAVRSLAGAERAVSSRRAAVIRVHDRLQEELKKRYRDNPAEIPTGV